MHRYIHIIIILLVQLQLSYTQVACDSTIQSVLNKLSETPRLDPLDPLLQNLECFNDFNLDSIFYFRLQDEYLVGNYPDVKLYFEKIYQHRLKDKKALILEIFTTYELGRYNEALILINNFNTTHEKYFPIQLLQCKIFQKKGEFHVSNNYLKKLQPRNHYDLLKVQIHIANNFIALEQSIKSSKIYDKLLKEYGAKSRSLLFNLANFNLRENDFSKAIKYYKKYLRLNSSSKNQFSLLNQGRVYANLMQCYGKLNNDSIFFYQDSAYHYKYQSLQKDIDPEYGAIHQNLAEYHLLNHRYKKTNIHIDSSIYHHIQYITNKPLNDLKSNNIDYQLIHDKLGLLEYIYIKYKICQFTDKSQIDILFDIIDNLIRAIKKENYGVQSKLFSQDKLSKYYQEAFLHYFNKNNLDKAIRFSQNLKGTILLESINHSEATDILEPEIRTQYLNLRYQRNKLISELIHNQAKDSLTNILSQNIAAQKELEQNISVTKPEFFNHLYTNESFETEEIQEALDSKSMLLDYVLIQDTLYQIRLSKHSITSKKIAFSKSNLIELRNIKEVISRPPSINQWTSNHSKKLKKQLSELCSKLLFPTQKDYSTIIVVAHDELKNFPFNTLTDSSNNYEYMIYSKQIQNTPNISLWLKNKNPSNELNRVLIVDPFSTDSKSTDYLPYAKYEVEQINRLFTCQQVQNTSLSDIKKTSIIHFLTHAVINDTNPMKSYLKMHKDTSSLCLENIKHSRIDNDLVFISSCASNAGLVSKNEGILSLSRSFLEAGTNCVVATYWPIDDYTSSQLVANFYSSLKNSKDVASSLQNAQIKHLEKAGYYESHPFFWAAFHLNGTNTISTTFDYFYSIVGLFITILLGLLLVRYKSSRNA